MRIRIFLYVQLVYLLFSVSCQKMDDPDVLTSSFRSCNTVLFHELQNRNQLTKLSFESNHCYMAFSDGISIRFSKNIFPIINSSDDGLWLINGNKTNICIKYNEEGMLVLPDVIIGDSNFWYIDGSPTTCSAKNYIICKETYGFDERYLKSLVIHNNMVSFLFSDKSSYSLSIIQDNFYLVPSFYKEHLIEKEGLAERAITESDNNGTAFIFFSDSHWNNNLQHSPALIRHITDYSGINKVFFGGDIIYKHESDPLIALKEGLAFQKAFSFLGPHFYCVYGNHDNNSDSQPNSTELHLSEEQVISFLQSQMTDLGKKEGYNFYFDEISSKTRYIGLDTGRYHYSLFRSDAVRTANFLIEALLGVPEDWHIIVISHIFLSSKKVDGKEQCCFSDFYNFPLTIMDNYNRHQAGHFTYNKETANYNFADCRGHIELCIGGHIHIPGLLFTEGGLPIITVPTDSKNVSNNDEIIKGTITEQSVSIVVVNYSSKMINLYSIGRGCDRVISLL